MTKLLLDFRISGTLEIDLNHDNFAECSDKDEVGEVIAKTLAKMFSAFLPNSGIQGQMAILLEDHGPTPSHDAPETLQ